VSDDQTTSYAPGPEVQVRSTLHAFPSTFFQQALEQASDERGWAHLGTFGSYLTKLRPDFDPRNFGYKKLSDLVKARSELFVTEERRVNNSDVKVLYVRAK
jgi:hypothetical protein